MSDIIKRNDISASKQADKLVINKVTRTDDMILVEGRVHCLVYFAFFKHFIVCSGDYGEWVFDCTWNTVQDQKPIIPNDESYLLSKVSSNNKKYVFDRNLFCEELKEWFDDLKVDFHITGSTLDDLQQLVNDFDPEDEYRYIAKLDEFINDCNNIDYGIIEFEDVSEFGMRCDIQLLVNVKMLLRLRDLIDVSNL